MKKLKNCPLCGGEVMLCQNRTGITLPEYSIICLDCKVEFKVNYSAQSNTAEYFLDPTKALDEVIEKFNRRV